MLRLTAGLVAAGLIVAVVAIYSQASGLTGTYASADGVGSMEFRGSKVYITTVLGTTFVSTYELDGERVVIKGAGGAQVFTRNGAMLDGGVGMKFVKQPAQATASPGPE